MIVVAAEARADASLSNSSDFGASAFIAAQTSAPAAAGWDNRRRVAPKAMKYISSPR